MTMSEFISFKDHDFAEKSEPGFSDSQPQKVIPDDQPIQIGIGTNTGIKDVLNITTEVGLQSLGVAVSKLLSENQSVKGSALNFIGEHLTAGEVDLGTVGKLADTLENSPLDAVKEAGDLLQGLIQQSKLMIDAKDFAGYITLQGEYTSKETAKKELEKHLKNYTPEEFKKAVNHYLDEQFAEDYENPEKQQGKVQFTIGGKQQGGGRQGDIPPLAAQVTKVENGRIFSGKMPRVTTEEITVADPPRKQNQRD
jgi:hypothetical protein